EFFLNFPTDWQFSTFDSESSGRIAVSTNYPAAKRQRSASVSTMRSAPLRFWGLTSVPFIPPWGPAQARRVLFGLERKHTIRSRPLPWFRQENQSPAIFWFRF